MWWEVLPRFSEVVLSSCNSRHLASEIRGDEDGGICVGECVGKDLYSLQLDGVDVSISIGKRDRVGETITFCLSKVAIRRERNGGDRKGT